MRTPGRLALALLLLGAAAICARLGFWQVGRYRLKQEVRTHLEAVATRPPIAVADGAALAERHSGVRVRLEGRFDPSRHVLLTARLHEGEPGVEVLTPLQREGAPAVLVHRGWLPAEDSRTAHPERDPVPTRSTVVGLVMPLLRGIAPAHARATSVASDSARLVAVHLADRDTLQAYVPYPIEPWIVHVLPGDAPRGRFTPTHPAVIDADVHLNYAVQWFAFAAVCVGIAVFWLVRRQPGRGP